jgi:hypothetical protein
VLTSCPKDELHQWFIGLYGEHIIPAIVHRYTQVLQRPDLFTLDRNGDKHALVSNEAVARVLKRLANRLLGVVSDTSTITITPEYAALFLEVYVKKTDGAKFTGDIIRFLMMSLPLAVRDLITPEVYPCSIYTKYSYVICQLYYKCRYVICRYILSICMSYARYILSLCMIYAELY